jgi:hypothetical protein
VQTGWKDVPHLDEEEKRRLVVNTPPYQIRASTEGEPALGVGAIYPIDEVDIIVPDRSIPDSWSRAYGMDVGWNLGQGEPASHPQAIRGRGDWIPG